VLHQRAELQSTASGTCDARWWNGLTAGSSR
jgi:hypothetical protein